jgi:murein DD-endopeptidase MepM/ murein hydrolase activator NlpD
MAIESDNITAVLARAQSDQLQAATIPLLRAPLDSPLVAASGFGARMHPIFATVRQHNGLDLGAALGDPIRAVEAGVVVMAEMRNGFGNTIVIDHGGKIASLYAHQSRFEVEVGDVVARGQLIGRIGSTGWSTGPHVHLEVRVAGRPVDPFLYLVGNEPIDCVVLNASTHAVDATILATRQDCR